MDKVNLYRALADVEEELKRAAELFPAMQSAREGWAVIWEELDELWEEVRDNKTPNQKDRLRKEAVQVAAMAIRFMVDVCQDGN